MAHYVIQRAIYSRIKRSPSSNTQFELRSHAAPALSQPVCNRYASRGAFAVLAPQLWNKLPAELRNEARFMVFRKRLKTVLFSV